MGVVQRASRNFIPSSLKIEKWEDLSSFFEDLQSRNIDGFDQLKTWLKDLSELEAVIEEDAHFYQLIREVLIANLHKHATNICIEVGRQNTPNHVRPSYSELEDALKETKKVAA